MTEPLDPLAKIRARLRRLRAMTVANGCTEAEAMRAAEIAMRLLDKYGLRDSGDIENDLSPQETFGRRRQVVDGLWPTVALVTNCEGFICGGDRLRFAYFGREQDVLVAVYLHELLLGAFRRECAAFRGTPEYLRRRKRKTRNAAMKAFQEGMAVRLRRKLLQLWWLRAKGSGDVDRFMAAGREHGKRLERDLQGRGLRFKSLSSIKLPDRRFDEARWDGIRAGERTGIDPGVAGGAVGLLPAREP